MELFLLQAESGLEQGAPIERAKLRALVGVRRKWARGDGELACERTFELI